jgi:hypothetical protein
MFSMSRSWGESPTFRFARQPIRHSRFLPLSSIDPKEYGRTRETASKSGKQIELPHLDLSSRKTWLQARFRQWEYFLRIGH